MAQMSRSLRKKLFVRAGLDPDIVDSEERVQERARKEAATKKAACTPIPR